MAFTNAVSDTVYVLHCFIKIKQELIYYTLILEYTDSIYVNRIILNLNAIFRYFNLGIKHIPESKWFSSL